MNLVWLCLALPLALPQNPTMKRIFISSTCHDLIDVRAELEEFIRTNLGLIPVLSDRLSGFEVEPHRDSITQCLANVGSSDVFLCILNQRYGSLLGKAGFTDVSATHLEYQKARELSKPIFFYVRDRLDSDYGVWRKNKEATLPWVKPNDFGIFNLLEEHKPLSAGSEHSNWYSVFKDSVELKKHVGGHLQDHSTAALMRRLIEQGKVPVLQIAGNKRGSLVEVVAQNRSPIEALHAKMIKQLDNPSSIVEFGNVALMQPNRTTQKVPLDMNDYTGKMRVQVQYETMFGHRIRDTFVIECNAEGYAWGAYEKRELLGETYKIG